MKECQRKWKDRNPPSMVLLPQMSRERQKIEISHTRFMPPNGCSSQIPGRLKPRILSPTWVTVQVLGTSSIAFSGAVLENQVRSKSNRTQTSTAVRDAGFSSSGWLIPCVSVTALDYFLNALIVYDYLTGREQTQRYFICLVDSPGPDNSGHCLAQARNHNLVLSHGWQGPNYLSHNLLPPRVHKQKGVLGLEPRCS